MGRCNGGGGRRWGGGGWQEGQNKGTKSGKTGHGKSGNHDASTTQREVQKRDKWGQPLNYGPFKNGYYVGGEKKNQSAAPQTVGMAEQQLAALSLLTEKKVQPVAVASTMSKANAAQSTPGAGGASGRQQQQSTASSVASASSSAKKEMTAAQRKESERLTQAQADLDASAEHEAMRAVRRALPAHASRGELLGALATSQTLVICGETGCGKSTQVPQFILEEAVAAGRGAACTVLIAQPRRVAAISLAERVAAERGERVGGSVGYSIRHDGVHSATTTRLLFCTSGVILRRLQEDPTLDGVSHIIVDEAHERTADGDFLLMVLRRLLRKRADLRAVLMSATLDAASSQATLAARPR